MKTEFDNTENEALNKTDVSKSAFKFRFWQPSTQTMQKWEDYQQYGIFEMFNNIDSIPLLFTGFNDKKGIEICQGDICKYHKSTSKWLVSYHFEVRFKNGAFYAYWEREMMGKLEQHWDLLSQKDMRNIRVVSNIFQSTQTTS